MHVPLVEQTLSLFDVAKHWQRVINARVDKWDVHEVLHRAWWQGEFEAGGLSESLRRKALMLMRELPPEDQGGIVFYEHEDELPPATIWHGDELKVVDYRFRIRLPVDPASWTETEITEACDTLAKVPAENLPSVIAYNNIVAHTRKAFGRPVNPQADRRRRRRGGPVPATR